MVVNLVEKDGKRSGKTNLLNIAFGHYMRYIAKTMNLGDLGNFLRLNTKMSSLTPHEVTITTIAKDLVHQTTDKKKGIK